jgi:hypothetical protein
MKRFVTISVFFGLFMLLSLSASAAPLPYAYVRSFDTDSYPLAIAVDVAPSSTTCYYATFNSGTSKVWMVRDFMTSTGPADQTAVSGNVNFVGGRGFQGVALDSTGKLYASGDSSGSPGLSNYCQRYTPNGDKSLWTLDGTFATTTALRLTGVSRVNDSLLVCPVTVAAAVFIHTSDGSVAQTLPANTNYGREATFIPDNDDVYIAHNDNGVSTPSLSIYIGGNPGNLAAYTKETDAALGGASATSSATQHNGYDPVHKYLLHVNMRPSGDKSVEIYAMNTAVRGQAAILAPAWQVINTYGPPHNPQPLADAGDVAAMTYGGHDYVLITSTNSSKIHVYSPAPTAVTDWELY